MSFTSKTLRPGLLVGLKTKITGVVEYEKIDIEEDHVKPDGTKEATWQTTRTIQDPAEFEAATKVRSKCRSLITGICATSDFGYLCPENRKDDLDKAITEAINLAEEFNLTATYAEVEVAVLTGVIASDDEKAFRAITGELAGLIRDMENGIRALSPEDVRKAANKAKKLGTMLPPDQALELQTTIDVARKVAVEIVKAGDQAAEAIDEVALKRLETARTAYLDIGDAKVVEAPEATAQPRGLDFDPSVETPAAEEPAASRAFDIEDLM
jgi:hypothetical protein